MRWLRNTETKTEEKINQLSRSKYWPIYPSGSKNGSKMLPILNSIRFSLKLVLFPCRTVNGAIFTSISNYSGPARSTRHFLFFPISLPFVLAIDKTFSPSPSLSTFPFALYLFSAGAGCWSKREKKSGCRRLNKHKYRDFVSYDLFFIFF